MVPFMAILYPLLEPACCLYNPYRRKEVKKHATKAKLADFIRIL